MKTFVEFCHRDNAHDQTGLVQLKNLQADVFDA